MTSPAASAPGLSPFALREPMRRVGFWAAFAIVHAWLWYGGLTGPNSPLNDVTTVYRDWFVAGTQGFGWVGIDRDWVYPSAALLPMLIAGIAGLTHYTTTWLVMAVALDGAALAILTRGGTSRRDLGWWWLAFLLLLGPIALGRLDTVSVPLALVGLLFAVTRPVLSGVLLGLASWIKVWPAAVVIAIVVASKRRLPVLIGAIGTSVAVVAVVLLFGGSLDVVTGFVGQQTGRGLQIEAPVSTWWLWLETAHDTRVATSFDQVLVTYQVSGPGTAAASMLMTPIMALVFAGAVVIGVRATRYGVSSSVVLAPLALALTTAFIVTNKVGSPQYQTWLAVPVLIGLLLARRGGGSFVVPAAMALAIAVLTQVIYPWNYDALVFAEPWMVAVITVRNALLVGMLVWALVRLWRIGSEARRSPEAHTSPVRGASPVGGTSPVERTSPVAG